jgi:outer membrane murein-binding lipoprotein Lpp
MIYKVDLGLLIAAAAVAAVLTARPAASQVSEAQADALATAVSEVSAAIQKTQEIFETWVASAEDPPDPE